MLYDPINISGLELKNRLVMPPMQSDRTDRGRVTDELVDYYRQRALYSQPGLIVIEHSCITEAGRASANQLSIADDDCIPGHRRLVDAIHEAGSRVFVQLNHGGNAAEPFDGGELVSASDVGNPRKPLPRLPRPLTIPEIGQLETAFVQATLRALEAGYDGVEIHCAHGYLLNQFYSPLTNRRTDAYGSGSIEDRTRFLREVMTQVRAAIGDTPMAVRLGGADYLPGGSTEEDAVAAARLIAETGADLLDVSGGMCGYNRPEHREPGYFGSMTEAIRQAVTLPVLLTGGVRDKTAAEELLLSGKADLIGVGRALFRDAHWAEKN
ncbi:MAG: NADH:flavin oxidoreductase [Oscillospiraceae bacterium]|nr:NADH:flavin oxidoreductase [Oscillospiraceae bacterium]